MRGSMESYPRAAVERAMKVQEVILRAIAKKIAWWQAAEILGISDRQMRRWRERYERLGYDGLIDRRRGKPSGKRVPLATVEQVLTLYREQYFDLNVSHFHEKLSQEHGIGLSYTWVKRALQGAGVVAREAQRGVHRKRRERRPLPGMLLHIDGSEHQWFQDERWYDLIVILDDATSEIYYAQLVEEESTASVMAGLRWVIERKGVFCSLYSDRASHFWLTPKVGGKVDPHRLTQVGRALRELGIQMIPAYSPQARGPLRTRVSHLAGQAAAGAATGRDRHGARGQRLSPRPLRGRVQRAVSGAGRQRGQRVSALCPHRPGPRLQPPVRTHREPRPHGAVPEAQPADRSRRLARHAVWMQGDRASTSGRRPDRQLRAAPPGTLYGARRTAAGRAVRRHTGRRKS